MAGAQGSVAPEATPASASEPGGASRCMSREDCAAGIRSALKHPTVRFLMERMEKSGCPVWPRLITATTCSSGGGYASRFGIMVCCNHMQFQDEINQVLIHELIHAYDDCVSKNLDWKNCAHHACSEIRANHLSGDCHYKRELLRGFMKIRGHEQVSHYLVKCPLLFTPLQYELPNSDEFPLKKKKKKRKRTSQVQIHSTEIQ
ncbi:hypothetical protein ABZP36_003228 [Zizania latifolia]